MELPIKPFKGKNIKRLEINERPNIYYGPN